MKIAVASPEIEDKPGQASSLESRIKQTASDLGFALCGIASADPPPNHASYARWIASGFAGEMEYLKRQEPLRADPRSLLAGARSLIVVALNYYSGPEDGAAGPTTGIVARYARFDDYHRTIWDRLNRLLVWLQTVEPGISGKAYCDTGPVTERDLAMRAGVGWIGKHTNLISRKIGNWFFLGAVIVDAALQVDAPHETRCGSCTRCLPACPTGAIVAPYQLDARRCISYLTIELKGSIPAPLRPLVGARIYGCDDCLAACPWNRFAVRSDDPAVRPRADLAAPDLLPLLAMDDDAFRVTFRNSPIRRTRRRGFLRNVCVALGNCGDSSAIPALDTARRTDREPLVQEHAEWAIEQIRTRESTR